MLIGHYPDFPERLAGTENPGNSLITDGNVNKIGIYVKIGGFLQILRKYFDFCYHISKKSSIFAVEKINKNINLLSPTQHG